MNLKQILARRAHGLRTSGVLAPDDKTVRLAKFLAQRRTFKTLQSPAADEDMRRILELPIQQFSPEELEDCNRRYVLADKYAEGFRLFTTQSKSVLTFERCGGLFAPIGVGWGKTLIAQMCAGIGYERGIDRIVYFTTPNVYEQFMSRDILYARSHVVLNGLPFYGMGQLNAYQRKQLAESTRKGCYVLPYSLLSTRDTEDVLDKIKPGLILADEAHHLKRHTSARTRRVMDYLRRHKPAFVAMSGTMTDKSLLDYHHLLRAAIDAGIPMPYNASYAVDWAVLLDANSEAQLGNFTKLRPLLDWAIANQVEEAEELTYTPRGFRVAYRARLCSVAGIVATGENEIKVSLTIENSRIEIPDTPQGDLLKKLDDDVVNSWLTPNGDEIAHAIHTFKWRFELTAGFYNLLRWPSEEDVCKKRAVKPNIAKQLLREAHEHHVAKNLFNKELRLWLANNRRRLLDTPFLVEHDLAQNGSYNVGDRLYHFWREAKELEREEMLERESLAVRVCDYKVAFAKQWALEVKEGIIWYYHQAIGHWLRELLPNALYCPAGKAEDILIRQSQGRIVLASIAAHGTGKNLQFHRNQIFVEFPRQAIAAEQVLGRTHRNGQLADELFPRTLRSTDFDDMAFAATLAETLYIQQTTGSRYKLIVCGYNPLPVIFPTKVLEERGFEPPMLDSEAERELREKFSPSA